MRLRYEGTAWVSGMSVNHEFEVKYEGFGMIQYMRKRHEIVYHRERILETSTLSCNEEEEEITKPPKR